jgi:hypothetical protein
MNVDQPPCFRATIYIYMGREMGMNTKMSRDNMGIGLERHMCKDSSLSMTSKDNYMKLEDTKVRHSMRIFYSFEV